MIKANAVTRYNQNKPRDREQLAKTKTDPSVFIPGTKLLKPGIARQIVRPKGEPESEGIDITDFTDAEKSEIARKNFVRTLAARKVEELGIIQEMQTAEREKELAPQLAALKEQGGEPSPGFEELTAKKPGQEAVDTAQALGAGTTAGLTAGGVTLGALSTTAGTAALGTAGAALGVAIPPLGVAAAVAAIAAFGAATYKLSISQKQDIANANKVVMLGHIGIGDAKTMANQGNPMAVNEFKRAKADILLGHKKLLEKSQEKLHWFESFKGQDELILAQDLVNDLPRFEQEIEIALLNPNPNSIVDFRQFYQNQGAEQ